ncbi:MAG: MarR family transcriptional regulator [Proteobacteria bacterium]|nr:MarR family transcriptional regulator [Pseudomonadota bacterium]
MAKTTNLAVLHKLREATKRLYELELADLDRQIKAIEAAERPRSLGAREPGNVPDSERAVLRAMQAAGEPLRAVQIREIVGASQPSIARWLKSLAKQGYVTRVGGTRNGTRYGVAKEVPKL